MNPYKDAFAKVNDAAPLSAGLAGLNFPQGEKF
jgi:hypothetical protein